MWIILHCSIFQVYFGMLDALLASEELPEEYRDRCQVFILHFFSLLCPSIFFRIMNLIMVILDILCNDCDKKGTARFHWLYHKCGSCGSYNTRVIRVDSTDTGCFTSNQWRHLSFWLRYRFVYNSEPRPIYMVLYIICHCFRQFNFSKILFH